MNCFLNKMTTELEAVPKDYEPDYSRRKWLSRSSSHELLENSKENTRVLV